jgi:hypothetical protein
MVEFTYHQHKSTFYGYIDRLQTPISSVCATVSSERELIGQTCTYSLSCQTTMIIFIIDTLDLYDVRFP